MRLLTAHSGPYGAHQDLGGRQEREVAVQLARHDRGERAELVQHRQEGLQQPVEGEERVRERHPADHGAGDVALVPLVAGQLARHRGVAAQDHHQAVDPLAGARVHLVRHGGRADLAGLEALGHQLVPGHQPDGLGHRGGRRGELHQRGDHVVVEGAGVDLADRGERLGEAEVRGDAPLQVGELVRVAAEQVQHVLGRADRALDPAQRVAREQVLQAAVGDQQLVGGGREALAQRRGLGGDVVRASGDHQLAVLGRELAEPGQHGDGAVAHQLQREPDLELLDVLRQVPRGHALVDLLVAGEGVELLDPGLHVMPGDLLALGDGGQVHLVEHALVVGEGGVRHLDPEVLLSAQHRQPQLTLQLHLLLGGPQDGQLRGGVAAGQDIGDARLRRHGVHVDRFYWRFLQLRAAPRLVVCYEARGRGSRFSRSPYRSPRRRGRRPVAIPSPGRGSRRPPG